MVHGQFSCSHLLKVLLHVRQLLVQTFQTHQLVCDSLTQSPNCCVLGRSRGSWAVLLQPPSQGTSSCP